MTRVVSVLGALARLLLASAVPRAAHAAPQALLPNTANAMGYPSTSGLAEPGAPIVCPILYYHETFGQAGFEAHLAAFLQSGYLPVPLGSLVTALENHQPAPRGCMVLTFDDGLLSQLSGAVPVLQRYMVGATFFVMQSFGDGVHRYMTPDNIRALRDAGFEIGSHTVNHASLVSLRSLNFGAYLAEIFDSRKLLESMLQQPVRLFAYPYGSWDAAATRDLEAAGYRAAVTTVPGTNQHYSERFLLPRITASTAETAGVVLRRIADNSR
ncbi:MAG: polysaccharide deacetylase family protein [Chloroflexi bacterium]|nr:polysaccharide deacetylase family protein [Chloroflexota bacterium]